MEKQTIDHLRQTEYMKLLEYAVSRVGQTFTKQDALDGTAVSTEGFDSYIDVIYSETSPGGPDYALTVETLPKYIAFRELEEAQTSAKEAKSEAKLARWLAVFAIVVTVVLASIQVYFQVKGDMKLDAGQVNQIVQASEATEKSQVKGLDAMISKLEETNKVLMQMNQKQTELLDLINKKPRTIGK